MTGVSSSRKVMVGVLLCYQKIQRDQERGWGVRRETFSPCFHFSFEQGSIMGFEGFQLSVTCASASAVHQTQSSTCYSQSRVRHFLRSHRLPTSSAIIRHRKHKTEFFKIWLWCGALWTSWIMLGSKSCWDQLQIVALTNAPIRCPTHDLSWNLTRP